jgi:adenylate kinase
MYNDHDITIIAGLSGVGKTFIIKKLTHKSDTCVHLSAGSLIKKRLENLDHDQLRKLDANSILANQYLMIEQFKEELRTIDKRFSIILDAHMVIDNDIEIIEVPYEIFEKLSPKRIIFLSEIAEKIMERREFDNSRKRPIRSISEISEQQNRSIMLAQKYSLQLSIPFIEIRSGDLRALSNVLAERQ